MEKFNFCCSAGKIGNILINSVKANIEQLILLNRNIDKNQLALQDVELNYTLVNINDKDGETQPFTIKNTLPVVFYFKPKDLQYLNLHYLTCLQKVIDAGKLAGTKKFIYVSNIPLIPIGQNNIIQEIYLNAEKVVTESGIDFSIIRVPLLMENLDFFIRGNRINLIGNTKTKHSWLTLNDLANSISKVALDESEQYKNKVVQVLGKEPYSIEEALKIYADIVKPGAKFENIPMAMMRSISTFSNNPEMKFNSEWLEYITSETGEQIIDTKEEPNHTSLKHSTTIKEWHELK